MPDRSMFSIATALSVSSLNMAWAIMVSAAKGQEPKLFQCYFSIKSWAA